MRWGGDLSGPPPIPREALGSWPGQNVEITNAPNATFACALFDSDSELQDHEQTSVDRDAGVAIVGDCRLDNRDDLAASLRVSGKPSDAQLLLRAYQRW